MKSIMQLEDYTIDELTFKLNKDVYSREKESTLEDVYAFEQEIFRQKDGSRALVNFVMECNIDSDMFAERSCMFKLIIKGI